MEAGKLTKKKEVTCCGGSEEELFKNCLYFSANKLARIITKMAEEVFYKTGLNPSYAFTQMLINNNPGLSQNELAKRLAITPSTLTRFLEKLELMELIVREQTGKISNVYPTEKGIAKQEELAKCWKTLHNNYSDILGVEYGDNLSSLIYSSAVNLEKK